MAKTKVAKKGYESKLKTVSIRFTSRASVKIKDSYFTVEACEERVVPDGVDGVDWQKEKKMLWDELNAQCDDQVQEIYDMFEREKKR